MAKQVGRLFLSNYVYCMKFMHMKHTTVCAVRCDYFEKCKEIQEYEKQANLLRGLINISRYGKQLQLFTKEALTGEEVVVKETADEVS